jgi:hypothetical protein
MMTDRELERLIAEKAEDDGQYAVAYALLSVAYQLKCLGTGDAATTMGAIELLGTHVGEKLGRVLINRQPNADLDAPPNVRYWG